MVFGSGAGFGTADGSGRQVIDLTSLSAAEGFIIQGDAAAEYAGLSVSAAGDVNGDGFDDLIVGAPYGDDGGTFAGEAYVVFGSGAGFGTADGSGRQVIDLTSLSAAEGFIIQGDAAAEYAGLSVSAAGDVNGDGFDDLIVGAPYGDDGGTFAGEAYVVFGSGAGFGTADGSGRQVIDLTSLSAAEGFIIQGDAAGDGAGYSISAAGDVNGDGFDDLIVGARYGDDGGSNAGEAYVVFGSGAGFGTADGSGRQVIDLTSLSAAEGFIIQGDAAGNEAGWSVSAAGDVNGDGFDDLILGASRGDDGGDLAGEAYVVFGSDAGFGTADGSGRQVIDLTSLSAAEGFIIQGDAAGDRTGFSVSAAGDVNGDGFDDLIVGARGGDDGGDTAGEAYVVFGGAFGGDGTPVVTEGTAAAEILLGGLGDDDLSGKGGADVIRSGAGDDALSVGDANFARIDGGTGLDTLSLDGAGIDLDLTQILPAVITSIEAIDLSGSGANSLTLGQLDVFDITEERKDGVAILRVTGDADDTVTFAEAGWANVGSVLEDATTFDRYALGNAEVRIEQSVAVSFPQVIDLTNLTTGQGFIIQGDAADDLAGQSVSGAGDVNGDGFDDLIVGAPTADDGGTFAGEAYVVFGSGAGFGTPDGSGRQVIDLASLSAAEGFIIQGDAAFDFAGVSVSAAGDVNGDGFDDLIVGARFGDDGGSEASEAYVVFGSGAGFGTADGSGRQVIDLTSLSAAEGFIIQGDAAGDNAGVSVSGAGDVNGDGFDDLIVGARSGDDGGIEAGEAYVVFGSDAGFGTVDGSGRQVIDLTSLSAAEGFIIQGDEEFDQAGVSVSAAGDVNGDGFDDLIVGARYGDDGGSNAGEAYVVFGSGAGFGTADGSGRQVIDLTSLSAAEGFIIQGDAAVDRAGWSVSAAGDVNGDGFDDLIVGAPGGADGGGSAGEAYVVFGSGAGFGTADGSGRQVIDLTSLSVAEGFIIQGDAAGDIAGYSVSAAGDVNGDGFDDLIVGAVDGDDGGYDAGEAYVVFGGAFGGDGTPVVTEGTAAAEILLGGLGDDDLSGEGGADVIRAGAGDDTITVGDADFARIDGGSGQDTLVVDFDLDLSALANDASNLRIQSIETIDITGAGDNTLTLSLDDLLDTSEIPNLDHDGNSHNSLVVIGNAGDTVTLNASGAGEVGEGGTWAANGNVMIGGENLNVFDFSVSGDVLGSIAIDPDIAMVNLNVV